LLSNSLSGGLSGLGCLFGGAFSGFGLGLLTGFGFFALAAFFGQLFFLAADQFGLPACFFFTTGQFSVVNGRFGSSFRRTAGGFVIAFDQGAFFAHFNLDRAGLAGGVGLLDFGR